MCAHNYSTWLIQRYAYISQTDHSSHTHASKHEHILTHAHTVSMDTQSYVSQARSFWLARVYFESELSSLKMWALFAIPLNQSFPLKTSATTHTQSFLPQLWLFRVSLRCHCACPVRLEEGRKKSDEEEGKKQRERLNSHSHRADCCPRWAWPCWHHDAGRRYVVHYRCQVSSFLHGFLAPCHPVVFSYCSSLPPSSAPSFLPFYILLSLSLSHHKR